MKQGFKESTCVFCGKNPVPHFLYWYFESVNILLRPIRIFLSVNFISRFLATIARRLNIALVLLQLGKFFKIIRLQKEIQACKSQRAKVMWQEAQRRGIKMEELLLFGRPFDVYFAKQNTEKQIIFSGLPRPHNYNNASLDWMDDKIILKRKLEKANLPVPKGGAVWNLRRALKIFRSINKPVIVKPRSGSRGRHSTVFVNTERDLKEAYKVAKQLCFWAVVEEQLQGPVYRATLVNFELTGVLRGDPPQIVGDGNSTVRELVVKKNQRLPVGVKALAIGDFTERFLFRQNLSFASKPLAGEVVNLSEKIGVNYGGSSREDFDICHPDNRALFVNAAKIVGDPIVGFDFIISDITKSWREQACGFIEANSLPFINLHHDPLLGKPRNVAAKVWDLVGF